MHFSAYFPVLLSLGTLALTESVGYWTLHNFLQYCEGDLVCAYKFGISENPQSDSARATSDSNGISECAFSVGQGADGKAANHTDWAEKTCTDADENIYMVNGGWSDQGFLTVVVTNQAAHADAFFAFDDDAVGNGKIVTEQERMAYQMGTFDVKIDMEGNEIAA